MSSAQEIARWDMQTLRLRVAELLGYSDMMLDDDEQMQGMFNGVMVPVPNFPVDPLHSSDLLSRLEWDGIAYAMRHEPVGPGEHYGFYIKGAHVLGPSRAIAICRGFLLACSQVTMA